MNEIEVAFLEWVNLVADQFKEIVRTTLRQESVPHSDFLCPGKLSDVFELFHGLTVDEQENFLKQLRGM